MTMLQIRMRYTCMDAEPVLPVSTVYSNGSKVWTSYKFTHVKSAYIARDQFLCATTNSVVSDPPQISAICDVVAQLIYLPNSRRVTCLRQVEVYFLARKSATGIRKKTASCIMQHQHGTPLVTPHLLFRIQISSDLGHRHFAGCAKLCTYSGLCLKFFGKGLDSIIFVFL